MKISQVLVLFFSIAVAVSTVWLVETHPAVISYVSATLQETSKNLAAVFFKESITISDLNKKYQNASNSSTKINLLIVPGHEPTEGGAEFGKLKERDMAVDLSDYLVGFFKNNSHYHTTVTRDKQNWNQIFSTYFAINWGTIAAFVSNQRMQMQGLTDIGLVKNITGAYHATAKPDVALRLYGINKWANENDVDIEIHIHFNNYPHSHPSKAGEYSGLTIYVPERQYSNSTTTRAIATSFLNRLSKYNAVSNLPTETSGVVEDQDLIAVGSNNNSDAASMLIEYGYIYEPQFQNPSIRDATLKDLAYQTYLGLEDFFSEIGGQPTAPVAYDTLLLPYTWHKNFSKTGSQVATKDVLALQSALVVDGEYPVDVESKNDCPRTGIFGNCTVEALNAFQEKHNIKGEKGFVGAKTRKTLNDMFGL